MIKIIQHLYHIIYNKELYYASKYSSHSKPVHWDDPEGWTGEGGERGGSGCRTHVHPWLIHVSVWQKPQQYCKVISLQLK